MPCQLSFDCLNEILERLKKDRIALHSCLLVNRLWCRVSVGILWRNVLDFGPYRLDVPSKILSTLIVCLPNRSKVLLRRNGIFISPPTSKPPLFNYASFCKFLPIDKIDVIIRLSLQQSITSGNLNSDKYLVTQEILKMFMSQISSLKTLTYYLKINNMNIPNNIPNNITFIHFPGARDCLANLSELSCNSDVYSGFFYQLSQICHNIQSLTIRFESAISNELNDLISSQNSLKYLSLTTQFIHDYSSINWTKIISSLIRHSNTITKLYIRGGNLPSSFISKFTNLQELILYGDIISSEELQYVTFTQLQNLKFEYQFLPKDEMLIKFLENNGKRLKNIHLRKGNSSLNLAIAKFCPNLKSLCTKLCMMKEIH